MLFRPGAGVQSASEADTPRSGAERSGTAVPRAAAGTRLHVFQQERREGTGHGDTLSRKCDGRYCCRGPRLSSGDSNFYDRQGFGRSRGPADLARFGLLLTSDDGLYNIVVQVAWR